MATLNLNSFEKAIQSLQKAWLALKTDPEDEFIRDACLQRFECTYALCGKFLERYLRMSALVPSEIDLMSFPNLIRTGCKQGLLKSEWAVWKQYREKRNILSHTYDEQKALEIIQIIPAFLEDVQYLLKQLKKHAKET